MDLIEFRLAKELKGDRTVVEVWKGDLMIATIYPHEDSVAVVSKYFKEVETDKKYPPKVTVTFEGKNTNSSTESHTNPRRRKSDGRKDVAPMNLNSDPCSYSRRQARDTASRLPQKPRRKRRNCLNRSGVFQTLFSLNGESPLETSAPPIPWNQQ